MRILVSGGGTGGHLMPVLALCQALQAQSNSAQIYFIGTGDKAEAKLVRAHGLTYYELDVGKFRRYGRGFFTELTDLATMRANLLDIRKVLSSRRQAIKFLRLIQPDVVFTKGSFVTVPVGLAAAKLHFPLVIHESDTVMGLANHILARKATAVATGFPVTQFKQAQSIRRLVYTGNPIRADILQGQAHVADRHFKLDPKLPLVFVIGGSGGAREINEAVWETLPSLLTRAQVIHQVGPHSIKEAARVQKRLQKSGQLRSYHPIGFIGKELADIYQRADIIISRCGANSLAEFAALKKPVILIPNPGATNHHQEANAKFLANRGAARVIWPDQLNAENLEHHINDLLTQADKRQALSVAIAKLDQPDAAKKLAQLVLKTGDEANA